jgi:NAD(P)-dependent dehydrogenase (short-subunit alcohol dehydrogenase family)
VLSSIPHTTRHGKTTNTFQERNGFWSEREDASYSLLDINLGHVIKLTRIALRTFVKNSKKGVVLVTSSIAGTNGHLGTPVYVASKHGTVGFVKSLAKLEELANVKVVGICPG